MAWYDFIIKPITKKVANAFGKKNGWTDEQINNYHDIAYDEASKIYNDPTKLADFMKDTYEDTFNEIKEGVQEFVKGATETFVDPLTGQTAENERTHETNEYNLKQVQDTNQANRDIATQTNETNKAIATENLAYQRELQEYQKALQQQIFEREDTAYQRTKADMLKAGLNPLTMQGTNGAGEAIAMTPLTNSFQAQMGTPMQAHQANKANSMGSIASIAPQILSVLQGVNSLKYGQLSRDSIALENDRKSIENYILARKYGIDYANYNGSKYGDRYKMYIPNDTKTEIMTDRDYWEASDLQREKRHKVEIDRYDSDTDFEKILTALDDWILNGRAKGQWNKIKEQFPTLQLFEDFLTRKSHK